MDSSTNAFPPATTTIFVSGGNGYIASHTIKILLEEGYTVKASVRSLAVPSKSAHLLSLPGAAERLSLCEGDIIQDGVFDEPLKGMHEMNPMVALILPKLNLPRPNGTFSLFP